MRGGFSFCGVDIADLGLEYAPALGNTYVFGAGEVSVQQEEFEGQDGGYFYGTTVKPKDFVLRCFFQDEHIAHGIISRIDGFFRRGRTGRLVFDKRDWLWYTATVINVDVKDLKNYKNGFITITLRAYYPFARHDYLGISTANAYSDYLQKNSGLLKNSVMPGTAADAPLNENINMLLYNGGTEPASVAIAIAGNAGEAVTTIRNKTTKQTCGFVAFTKADTTDAGKYILLDGINGKTLITDGTESEYGFMYHDHGFIELAPSFPIERNVSVLYNQDENTVNIPMSVARYGLMGKYIYLENGWRKITGINDAGDAIVDYLFSGKGNAVTNIVTMNEISIELSAGAELTKLEFIYKPTFW